MDHGNGHVHYLQGKRAILGNSMDITERKEASRRLEELEALESSILDAIPQAVVGLHQRRINFANHAVKVIFGWHREELIGKSITMIYRNAKEAEVIADLFYSRLENQRTYEMEFPCLRKDGQEIICRIKASRIGEKLREKRIVVTYEDITTEKRYRKTWNGRARNCATSPFTFSRCARKKEPLLRERFTTNWDRH